MIVYPVTLTGYRDQYETPVAFVVVLDGEEPEIVADQDSVEAIDVLVRDGLIEESEEFVDLKSAAIALVNDFEQSRENELDAELDTELEDEASEILSD